MAKGKRKKKKQVRVGLGIGVFALFIVLASIGLYFGSQGFSVTGGATVMSIDNANFVSNNPELNADAYLVDVIINQGGEELVYTVQPQEVCQYLDGECPSGEFTIEFHLRNVSCNYEITDEETPFYRIYQATSRVGLCSQAHCTNGCASKQAVPWNSVDLNTVVNACLGSWGEASRIYRGYPQDTRPHSPEYCGKTYAPLGTDLATPSSTPYAEDCNNLVNIQETPVRPDIGQQASEWAYLMPGQLVNDNWDGDHWQVTHIAGAPQFRGHTIGTVASPKFEVDVTIINEDGEKSTATISSEKTSALLDDIGRVKFAGGLIAQEFCPIPAIEKKIVEDIDTEELRVVQRTKYEQYQDTLFELQNLDNNYFAVADTDPGVGADVIWSHMSTMNALVRELGEQNIQDNCYINDNRIYVCEPERDVIYPELQLLIKADWVGIQINSGEPRIDGVELEDEYLEGEVNLLKVSVTNVGDVTDSFDIGMTCGGSPVNLGNFREPIAPTDTVQLNINFVLNDGDHDCEVKVASVNNPLAVVTEDVEITVAEKEFPTTDQCDEITDQPSGTAYWEGYPICEWRAIDVPQQSSSNYGVLIAAVIIGLVAVAIIVTLNKRKGGKKGKK